MGMVQTFFLSILLFFHSIIVAPFVYDVPKGAVDYGGGAYEVVAVQEDLPIYVNGQTDYVIVVPDDAPQSFFTGTKWLNEFISEMVTGVKSQNFIPVLRVSQAGGQGKFISLGETGLYDAQFAADLAALKSDEDFIKRAIDGSIFIAGRDKGRGTMYGCADFIEQELGCRWFLPDITTANKWNNYDWNNPIVYKNELKSVPRKQNIAISAKLDTTSPALLEYRDNYWATVFQNPEFKAFHKINSFMGSHMGEEYGQGINFIGGFCHTMHDWIPQDLIHTQPELFALRGGSRIPDQRCLSNPAVVAMTTERVLENIERHKQDGSLAYHQYVSVTQEDNNEYCLCDNCQAFDAKYGGPSGTNIWFTNQIARAVKAAYPEYDIMVDTFAYGYTLEPPTKVVADNNYENVPDENVIVRMCSIDCCFNHPIRDCGSKRGDFGIFHSGEIAKESFFAEYLTEWGKLCDQKGAQISIWDYTTNFNFNPTIFPNLHVLGANLQLFYENNARGVFEQGFDAGGDPPGSGHNGEFSELRSYVLSKLLWNPYLNVNQIIDEFMVAYYGSESAPFVKEFLDTVTNKAIATNHLSVFSRPEANVYFNTFDCKKLGELFDKAEAKATSDVYLKNIQRTRLCLRLYKANMMVGEFSWLNPNRINENKKLFHDCVMLGMDNFSTGMMMPYSDSVWLYRPYDWASPRSWVELVDESKLEKLNTHAYRENPWLF